MTPTRPAPTWIPALYNWFDNKVMGQEQATEKYKPAE